jgi:plasmid stabilization system protein ParE
MNIEYTKRFSEDLSDIAAYYADSDQPMAAVRLADRIQDVVARITRTPGSGRPVSERPGVRVVTLRPYRYKVFYSYTASGETVRILHIRHTSRRSWPTGPV